MGCHSLLQEIFPTQGSNPGLPHCRQTLYHLNTREGFCYTTLQISSWKWKSVSRVWLFVIPWTIYGSWNSPGQSTSCAQLSLSGPRVLPWVLSPDSAAQKHHRQHAERWAACATTSLARQRAKPSARLKVILPRVMLLLVKTTNLIIVNNLCVAKF